jgi:tripartite-type tricarboxylate transporter receptor subunit TctC
MTALMVYKYHQLGELKQMNYLKSICRAVFAITLFSITTIVLAAQVKIVIPFPPGGGSDWQAQHIAKWLKETRNIDTVLVHKPGAEGLIGARELNSSAKDGTAIGIFTISALSKVKEEAPVTPVSALRQPATVLVVRPDLAVKDYDDFINKMRTTSYNIGVVTASNSVLWKQIKNNERIAQDQTMVNFKGGSQMAVNLAGGHIDAAMLPVDIAREFISSGKLRALATSFAIDGIDGVVLEKRYPSWVDFSGFSMVVPGDATKEVQNQWIDIAQAYLTDPNVLQDFKRLSSQSFKIGPDQLNTYVKTFDELLK